MTKKKPDQATRDHNQAVSDVKNKRGFREPIGFVKEHFFGNAKERNGNYRKGYDYQKKDKPRVQKNQSVKFTQ